MADRPKLGVLTQTERMNADELVRFMRFLEDHGYESYWLPELFGREPMALAGYLLGNTSELKIATGIANVYVRDANATAQIRRTLAELSGGRFMLGLGVSNVGLNTARGHQWEMPLPKMRSYLDAMDAATLDGPKPEQDAPLYIAAHGPRLQALGAARTDGVITYLMPPVHARASRERIGPQVELTAVCPFVAATDPEEARGRARKALAYYMTLDYYHREWTQLGFDASDFEGGGSDRLIDTLVAWGDTDALNARLTAFSEAGASRVLVMPFDGDLQAPNATLSLLAG